ncbi:MAG: uroporphyrinogen decarboxylase family protein [Phycisphaeraceae bacterium]|nr:uroporphyrinogen decarboxylase family protein [Phycisphaeraceae bacterium]
MNSLERMMAALNGQPVDQTPVAIHHFLVTGRYAGFDDLGQWLQDGDMLAAGQLASWRELRHDALLIENGVTAMAQALGSEIVYPKSIPPHVRRPLLADGLEGLDHLRVPDPRTAHPLCEVLKAVRICRRETQDKVFIMGRADQGPNALAMALRGPEQWLMDLMDPDQDALVTRVLELTTACCTRYALALLEAGAHGSCIGGAGVSVLSPQLYMQREWPHQRSWCQAVRDAGGRAFVHACGNEQAILDDMADTGAHSLELAPDTPLTAVRELMLRLTPVLGMLSPILFEQGTTDELRDHVRRTLKMFAGCSRFIIGPGCALPVDSPLENLAAFVDEVRRYPAS